MHALRNSLANVFVVSLEGINVSLFVPFDIHTFGFIMLRIDGFYQYHHYHFHDVDGYDDDDDEYYNYHYYIVIYITKLPIIAVVLSFMLT